MTSPHSERVRSRRSDFRRTQLSRCEFREARTVTGWISLARADAYFASVPERRQDGVYLWVVAFTLASGKQIIHRLARVPFNLEFG